MENANRQYEKNCDDIIEENWKVLEHNIQILLKDNIIQDSDRLYHE